MNYRLLGRTGLRVSELSLGAMTFGQPRSSGYAVQQLDTAAVRQLIDIALDAGVNLIDTADVYGGGASEEALGEALAGRRDRILVATKLHGPTGTGPNDLGQSRHHIIEACEASLRRLRIDHIDLYQVHGFDPQTDVEETLLALDHLVQSGMVRAIGCSNLSAGTS